VWRSKAAGDAGGSGGYSAAVGHTEGLRGGLKGPNKGEACDLGVRAPVGIAAVIRAGEADRATARCNPGSGKEASEGRALTGDWPVGSEQREPARGRRRKGRRRRRQTGPGCQRKKERARAVLCWAECGVRELGRAWEGKKWAARGKRWAAGWTAFLSSFLFSFSVQLNLFEFQIEFGFKLLCSHLNKTYAPA
jgi:hypothetical protein